MKIRRMRIACWIPKATNTDSGCVILIALPLQQWLHERASVLSYTYIACRVFLLSWFNLRYWYVLFIFLSVPTRLPPLPSQHPPAYDCHRYNVTPSCSLLCWRPPNPEPLSPSLYQYHFQHARLLTAKSDVMPYWKDAAFLPHTAYNTLIYIIFDRRIAWRILIERLPRPS